MEEKPFVPHVDIAARIVRECRSDAAALLSALLETQAAAARCGVWGCECICRVGYRGHKMG